LAAQLNQFLNLAPSPLLPFLLLLLRPQLGDLALLAILMLGVLQRGASHFVAKTIH